MFSATSGSPPSYSSLKISLCSSSSEILAFSAGDSSVKGRGAGGGTVRRAEETFSDAGEGRHEHGGLLWCRETFHFEADSCAMVACDRKTRRNFFDPPKGVRLFTKPHGSHTPSPVPVTREFRISRQIGQSANQIALVSQDWTAEILSLEVFELQGAWPKLSMCCNAENKCVPCISEASFPPGSKYLEEFHPSLESNSHTTPY